MPDPDFFLHTVVLFRWDCVYQYTAPGFQTYNRRGPCIPTRQKVVLTYALYVFCFFFSCALALHLSLSPPPICLHLLFIFIVADPGWDGKEYRELGNNFLVQIQTGLGIRCFFELWSGMENSHSEPGINCSDLQHCFILVF